MKQKYKYLFLIFLFIVITYTIAMPLYKDKVEFQILTSLAKKGDANAQYELGHKYHFENNDYVNAIKWYTKSSEQNQSEAQGFLGSFYQNGFGLEKDCKKSIYWYQQSSQNGNEYSQWELGNLYYFGDCSKVDYNTSYKLWRPLAENGMQRAQYSLASLYCDGAGVKKDYRKCAYWLTKARNQYTIFNHIESEHWNSIKGYMEEFSQNK